MTFKMMASLVALLILCFAASSSLSAQPADREALIKELRSVQSELSNSLTNLAANQKALWQKQHDLEYGDSETMALRQEIIALEKQLIEKQRQLQVRLKAKPEFKLIEAERVKLFREVEQLREQEAAIRRELSALDTAPALEP